MSHVLHLRQFVGSRPLLVVGAGVLVLDARDRVLLQRRADNGLWGIPGGSSDLGETLEQTARRELLEEAGLVAGPLERLSLYSGPDFHFTYPNGDEVSFVGAAYLTRLADDAPTLSGDHETLELRFFALDALPAEISGSLDRAALRDLGHFLGRPIPAWPASPPPVLPAPGLGYMAELRALIGPQPTFSVGADVLARDEWGRVLLLRRFDSGAWSLPGGHLELGERLEDAARRAFFEETGIRAEGLDLLDVLDGAAYAYTDPNGDQIYNFSALFEAKLSSDVPLLADGSERIEARWFEPDQWPADLAEPVTRAVLARLEVRS